MDNNQYVLSCIDGSAFSEAVCDYSAWIAKGIQAPLKFLHTVGQPKGAAVSDFSGAIGLGTSEDLLHELAEVEQMRSSLQIKKGNIMLKAAQQRATDAGVENVKIRQQHGSLAESLIDMEDQIRVLVIGIRGEAHQDQQGGIGAHLESTIRALHKPTLVVNNAFSLPRKTMLAYDGSSPSNKALEMVSSNEMFKNMPCHLVHVSREESTSERLLEKAASQLTSAGIDVTTATLNGKTEKALINYQAEHDIDLTVMGAFGHNRMRDFLLGSFTAKMLEKTNKPLLLLR